MEHQPIEQFIQDLEQIIKKAKENIPQKAVIIYIQDDVIKANGIGIDSRVEYEGLLSVAKNAPD